MFNTINATKKYVPVHDRAKTYAYGYKSPRARRFVASIRQLVHHDGATKLDTSPACLAIDEPFQSKTAPESLTLEDIIEEFQSK